MRGIRAAFREAADRRFTNQQRCKVCGRRDKFNFYVPDDVWRAIVPFRLQNRVVCLGCFDRMAKEKGVEYAPHLLNLYFAGDQASFSFSRTSCSSGGCLLANGLDDACAMYEFGDPVIGQEADQNKD